jgi:hypothetical protein
MKHNNQVKEMGVPPPIIINLKILPQFLNGNYFLQSSNLQYDILIFQLINISHRFKKLTVEERVNALSTIYP